MNKSDLKIAFRFIIVCFLVVFLLLAILSISPSFAAFFSGLLDKYFVLRLIVGIVAFIGGAGILCLWGYLIYHWGNSEFKNQKVKLICFLILILGMFFGGAVYYILVYEKKLFLK